MPPAPSAGTPAAGGRRKRTRAATPRRPRALRRHRAQRRAAAGKSRRTAQSASCSTRHRPSCTPTRSMARRRRGRRSGADQQPLAVGRRSLFAVANRGGFRRRLERRSAGRGLARAAGVPAHPCPMASARCSILPQPARGRWSCSTIWPDRCTTRMARTTARPSRAGNTRWFAPAWRALAAGAFGRLRLIAPTAYGTLAWDTARAARWHFWRRPRALADTAKALAGPSPASAGEAA